TGRLLLIAGGIGNTPFLGVAREALGLRTYAGGRPRVFTSPYLPTSSSPHLPKPGAVPPFNQPPAARALSPRNMTFCYGTRSAECLAGLDDFAALGIDVRVATDDGSRGHRGLVTDLVAQWLADFAGPPASPSPLTPFILCCGPEPMMHAVAALAAQHRVPCWL